ncbi:MAG TPA: single-stranded-DNA-specific exonuclease RecJ [Pseudomonadales bacterium]
MPQFTLRPRHAGAQFASSLHPVLQAIYAARGLRDDADIDLSLAGLLPPSDMLNIDRAVDLLVACLREQKRVLIVADFDADGATSCALSVLCLRAMGFRHVDYLVPNRFEYGYGLTPEIVHVALTRAPQLLMTVDNGIASHAGIDLARQHGIDVLVTDHHLPASTLPDANCILNPNQPGCRFGSKALAGVGVVFYLMVALRAALRARNWFALNQLPEPNMGAYLDLVALGTVADVVPLDQNNRRLVKQGLHNLRAGRARPGILALLDVAGRNPARITASDLGFAAGPRLNAAGRLDDMTRGIECLLEDDPAVARACALELDGLNRDRRLIEQGMQQEALAHLQQLQLDAAQRRSLCLYDSRWHQGVIGILASRLKDRLHRPVVIFADAGAGDDGEIMIKGSARSIAGVHIRDLFDAVATHNPGLLTKFGGHAMAAGLSLRLEDFDSFSLAVERELQHHAGEHFMPQVYTDGALDDSCFSLEFAQLLREAGPWGQHFPEPLFDGEFPVVSARVLSGKHLKLVLQIPGTKRMIDAIAFNQPHEILEAAERGVARVHALYRLDVNEYNGNCSPQLLVERLECR